MMENKSIENKNEEHRWMVHIGTFKTEQGALARAKASRQAGFVTDIIDTTDDGMTNIMAGLLLIAEQLKEVCKRLDAVIPQNRNAPTEKPDEIRSVRELISTYRRKANMTRDELGTKVGISGSTVANYECGQTKNIPTKTLWLIADALKIPTREITKFL